MDHSITVRIYVCKVTAKTTADLCISSAESILIAAHVLVSCCHWSMPAINQWARLDCKWPAKF